MIVLCLDAYYRKTPLVHCVNFQTNMSKSVTISNQGELAKFTESNKEGDVQLRVEFPMSQVPLSTSKLVTIV